MEMLQIHFSAIGECGAWVCWELCSLIRLLLFSVINIYNYVLCDMALTSVHCKIREEEIVSSSRIQMRIKNMVPTLWKYHNKKIIYTSKK